jgi:hypothetical protein
MSKNSRAWILLPAAIIAIAVTGFALSSRQEELGLMDPGKSSRAALAVALAARDTAGGAGPEGYNTYSHALLVAIVAQKNAAPGNAADSRVRRLLAEALDCLSAAREAWQAELDGVWDPATAASPGYWNALHPALGISGEEPLTATEVRRIAGDRITVLLEEATDLTD